MTISEIAQKHSIHPQQISNWKREFLPKVESVFEKRKKSTKTEKEELTDSLHKIIGQQKVEIDFLNSPCARTTSKEKENEMQGPFQIKYHLTV